MKRLTSPDVAKLVGIHWVTLERWLATGKIPAPKPFRVGRQVFRDWTPSDIRRVKEYKAKFYRKGRGRRKKNI